MTQAFNQLEAVRTIKANQVSGFFQTINDQILTFSEDRMVVDAMKEFQESIHAARHENEAGREQLNRMRVELRDYYTSVFAETYKKRTGGKMPDTNAQFLPLDDDSVFLQFQYVKSNPNGPGSTELLDGANDMSRFSQYHRKYHPVIRSYLKKFEYNNIFLVDIETGDIVYSVFKELDFTTSLKDGPYSKTNLGRAFRQAASADSPDFVDFADYEAYTPAYEAAASFIASPIFDGRKLIGVAIFQMPIGRINDIMAERTGLGETGETYAVGPDKLFRNDSRFLNQLSVSTTIINPAVPVNTEAVASAHKGESGIKVISNYRGEPVLSSWKPITIQAPNASNPDGIRWALMSEINLNEVRTPMLAMGRFALSITGMATILVLWVSYKFANGFTRQTDSITNMLHEIGIGHFEARADVISQDELGGVAHSINSMCDNTLSLIQSREERDAIQASMMKLMEEVSDVASGDLTVEANVADGVTGSIADSINFMIGQLRKIVSNVKDATVQVSSSANQIQSTTEHLSRGSEAQATQIVDASTAIDEMAASINQVAENTNQSAAVARQARENASQGSKAVQDTILGMDRIRDQVQDSAKRIKRLGESSQEIGEIVQLISDIADRTSILALNASIQAAMAGEAGQGFAVVAEEVERLAERSTDATKQIAALIKAIQSDTAEAISAMEESTKEVVNGSNLAVQAGDALSEIDSVSQKLDDLIHVISLATKQQARVAEELSKSMNGISNVTQQTAAGTKQAAVSVSDLAQLADELRASVSMFKLPARQQSFKRPKPTDDELMRLPQLNATY
jgi:methyl-accepting chemotaxis protein